jgi:hypothetical protein
MQSVVCSSDIAISMICGPVCQLDEKPQCQLVEKRPFSKGQGLPSAIGPENLHSFCRVRISMSKSTLRCPMSIEFDMDYERAGHP